MQSFEPNDIIQFVHLKLFVNGKRINEISVFIDKDKLIETATSKDIKIETPEEKKKKAALIIKKYRPVAVAELNKFNGFRVKIETVKNKQFKGVLDTQDHPLHMDQIQSGNRTRSIHI